VDSARDPRGGGDALIAEAALVEGLDDAEIRGFFAAARDQDYAALLRDGRPLLRALSTRKSRSASQRRQLEQEAAKLRRRFGAPKKSIAVIAPKRALMQDLLNDLQRQRAPVKQDAGGDASRTGTGSFRGRIWVTRRDVHVDRIASAWLIRRFIDPDARFRFVDPDGHTHRQDELRFDMFEAEFTHVGDACTFETLSARFVSDDVPVREIGEIVHDVDWKDGKFQREEAPGLRRLIAGLAAAHAADEARLERGAALFDDLYAAFASTTGKSDRAHSS
jgi:hypothetical protein